METQSTHKKTITIEFVLDRAKTWDTILSLRVADPAYNENDLIDAASVNVSENYVIDFNLYNGNEETGPWLDVILFDDSCEVSALDPEHESISGKTFEFFVEDEKLRISVIVQNKE